MIKQDNKLIFDIDKKYVAGRSTVLNNVNRKQFLLNKNIVVYAYIKEIEFNTDDIKVKLNSTDDTETIITLDKTATDNTGIPEYTTPDAKTEELNYALTLFVNEAYKDFKAGTNITPPPAVDVSEYERRIQELESQIHPDLLSVYDINLAELSITRLSGGYSNSHISGGEIQIELYPGKDDVLLPTLNQAISVLDVKLDDESLTLGQNGISNHTQKTCIHCGLSFDVEYNDTPIPISVTIKNNQTNKEYTITDSISVENEQIVLNGGGGQ